MTPSNSLFDDESESPAPTAPGANAPELTVSDLSSAVKRTVEDAFGHVRVRGEIGRVSRPRSGHVYLSLKDDRAALDAVMWKGVASQAAIQPEEGLEVIAVGRLTTFGGQSKYQLIIESLEPAGEGALMLRLERLKKKLAAEGLFDPARKRALPFLPRVVGVVASPSGAVIQDILHRLRDRFPCQVVLWPAAAQGARCAQEVEAAIAGFSALTPEGSIPRPDVVIVARGGGSLEDLWGFNEEIVVRAASASTIPIISAVGHETDTTLIDFAADRRAPTPSAAAEMATPVRADLIAALAALEARRGQGMARLMKDRRQRLNDLSRGLPRPDAVLLEPTQRLEAAGARLPLALASGVQVRRTRFAATEARVRPETLTAWLTDAQRRLADLSARGDSAIRRAAPQAAERVAALSDRLTPAVQRSLARHGDQLTATGRLLDGVSHRATLARGYAVARNADGSLIQAAAGLTPGADFTLEFADGTAVATAQGPVGGSKRGPLSAGTANQPKSGPVRRGSKTRGPQGELF